MDLFFLEGKVPLSKTFIKQADGGYEQHPYPMVRQVTSKRETVTDIDGFAAALQANAAANRCLLKGKLSRDLDRESRAGESDPFAKTEWVCLDFDHLESESQLEPVLSRLGLGNVSYVLQYGSSHKITKKFSAHVFMLLEEEILPDSLKVWLMAQNLEVAELDRRIGLSRSNAALLWPLDVSVAHNHMLIYIASPTCQGFDDPVEERVRTVHKALDKIPAGTLTSDLDIEVLNQKRAEKLNELRKAKGLKAKKFRTKLVSGVEVLSQPGSTIVTGQKEARGFMYLNLNGGDSWGYFHPLDNPEIIRNFKGEPNYLTKELLPDYYKAYKTVLRNIQREEAGDLKYLAFLDRASDSYYRGTYDPSNQELNLYPTSSVKKVEDFLKQNNQWVGEFIEEWDYLFRFDDPRIIVPEEKFVNKYQETEVMKAAREAPTPTRFPPVIHKVLMSLTSGDPEATTRLINWLAYIVQKRRPTQTAWVFSGVQGIGKGLLFHDIMTPILGSRAVQVKRMSSLTEEYNAYMEDCVLLLLDEARRDQMDRAGSARARLYQAITDPVIPIRAMRTDHYMAKNYMNVIVAANHRDAIEIESTDRRFNVTEYQDNKLHITDAEYKAIADEVVDFASILLKANVDVRKARTAMDSSGKEAMKILTISSIDALLQAISQGNLQELIDLIPSNAQLLDPMDAILMDKVKEVVRAAEDHAAKGLAHTIEREELQLILHALSGESVPSSVNKFTHMVKHYGIFFERIWVGDRRSIGIEVKWQKPEYDSSQTFGRDTKLRSVK